MSARLTLLSMLAGTGLLVAPALRDGPPRLVWNSTASAPVGLYRAEPVDRIDVADLVAVDPPEALAGFLAERGYLPRGVPLIKRVLALPGTTVCRHGGTIIAYDSAYGDARTHDSRGRPLPVWQGCRLIGGGELFLMNWDAADSLDGRYFGPLPSTSVVARLVPVWTNENGDGRFRWHSADPSAEP